MTTDQKIIKARVGLLELARQLGNVSEACKIMGDSRDTFYRYSEMHENGSGLWIGFASDRDATADAGLMSVTGDVEVDNKQHKSIVES